MDKNITMSQKEVRQYNVIQKIINKEINGTQASKTLNLSTRQIRRIKAKVRKNGIKGLVHANRGKKSNRKIPKKERQKIVNLINKRYSDFGPLLASEKLEEQHGIKRDKSTIRSIMINEGIWKPKSKKKEKHREWRQRKANFGEMIQYDGSYEHWFEDRGEKCCLLACIDDANSKIWMKLDKHEGVEPTFNFWREYIQRFGKPYSIYVDRFSTYSMNHKLARENPDTLTQFQRAMEKDLNIEVIHAGSAQAKGRVEVLFKTLQDRLIKELRLNNISTIEKANEFLEKEYIDVYNSKFMVEARSKSNLHKKITKKEKNNLDSIFSRQYEKVVRNDFTINYNNNWHQLTKEQPVTVCKKDRVTVEERLDNSIYFRLRGKYLNHKLLPERPEKLNKNNKNIPWVITTSQPHQHSKPAINHPWRKTIYNTNKLTQKVQVGHF